MTPSTDVLVPPTDAALRQAMYEQLHSEINTRLEQRQNIVTFTLLLAGSLTGVGVQSWANDATVLCYPVLALFLALLWSQHDRRIGQAAAFLRETEERLLDASMPGWERWRRERYTSRRSHLAISAKGVFVASDLLALAIGLARFFSQAPTVASTVLFVGLFTLDLVALALTVLAIRHER